MNAALLPLPAPPGDGPLLAGFSGGLDSTVLMLALAAAPEIRRRGLSALHVDHGLHPQSAAWAAHCVDTGRAFAIDVAVVRVAVDTAAGLGREGAARAARMAVFAAALPAGGLLALAHHRDDQAETLLLRALRASGVDALGAMAPLRRIGGGQLWRPLLDVPRATLQAYAAAHGLAWIEDPSNADDDLDRNFLRHHVLPLLRERWPQADAALARSAALAREASLLLDVEDAAALAAIQGIDPRTLCAAGLRALPGARQARVLRRWIAGLGLPPIPAGAIARVRDAVHRSAPGPLSWAGTTLRHWRGQVHAIVQQPALPPGFRLDWDGTAPLVMPRGRGVLAFVDGGGDARAPAGHAWTVRARSGGERIVLTGRRHSHALKHVLQDLGVPPWERDLPLLHAADGALEAAGDLVFSARFDDWLRTHGLGLSWRPVAAAAPVPA